MTQLRIFSYLPNPRVWKATIAARLCGVDVEVCGAPAGELADWLWDFDAAPIARADPAIVEASRRIGRTGFKDVVLHKTDAFLAANPFGTVPAAFSPDGETGLFESNSIMRAVARLGAETWPLYGVGPYEASRIDSFLDVSLVFARDAQLYLFALRGAEVEREVYARAAEALDTWLGGLETALTSGRGALTGDRISLADICFACELALFHNEGGRLRALEPNGQNALLPQARQRFPLAFAHFGRLVEQPAFAPDLGPYVAKLQSRYETARSPSAR
jgi:glutathione S-transferase